jgi:hypothetical protein
VIEGNYNASIMIAQEELHDLLSLPVAERLRIARRLIESALAETNDQAMTPHIERPFYETATPEEWVREFTKWAESHGTNTPGLTREDVSRERMYED